MEQWKRITDFENYEISDRGRCRKNYKGGKQLYLKPLSDKNGYIRYNLHSAQGKKVMRAHRLVFEHFVAPIADGMQVNHIDANKENNRVSNLEVVSHHRNMLHAAENGIMKRRRILKNDEVSRIKWELNVGAKTCVEIAQDFKVQASVIYDINQGKTFRNVF